MNETTTIFLTKLQASQFLEFQKNHAMFVLMQQSGVFNIKFGKAIINFSDGKLMNITKEEVVWHA